MAGKCIKCGYLIPKGQDSCTSCYLTGLIHQQPKQLKGVNMYYFVLTNPDSTNMNLSMYFKSYKEALEYAKSVTKNNPKIIEYDTSVDHSLMYDNILHIIK